MAHTLFSCLPSLYTRNGDDQLALPVPFRVLSIKHWVYVSNNSCDVSFQTWLTGFKTHLSDINSRLMNIRR